MARDRDGAAKNLQIIRDELSDVWLVWGTTHADQPGWTHELMQKMRDLVRHAPVTVATVFLSGGASGRTYQVRNRITTVAGRTDDRTISVVCRNR